MPTPSCHDHENKDDQRLRLDNERTVKKAKLETDEGETSSRIVKDVNDNIPSEEEVIDEAKDGQHIEVVITSSYSIPDSDNSDHDHQDPRSEIDNVYYEEKEGEVARELPVENEDHSLDNDDSFWSPAQLEILESCVDSFKYLPKTTVAKLYQDLNKDEVKMDSRMHEVVSKETIRHWLTRATGNYDFEARYDSVFETIEFCNDEIVDPLLKADRVPTKLTFSEIVKVKNFNVESPSPCFLGEYETETETSLMDKEENFKFSDSQVEVLESGLCSYKYFPKIIVKKLFKELRAMKRGEEGNNFSKNQISSWLKASSEPEETPFEVVTQQRLEELHRVALEEELWRGVDVEPEPRQSSKVRFSAKEEVKLFDKTCPASQCFLLGDEEGNDDPHS